LLPALAPLEAPVMVRAALRLGLDGSVQGAEADLSLGAGALALGEAPVGLAGGRPAWYAAMARPSPCWKKLTISPRWVGTPWESISSRERHV
jgi:hypothetical protein